MFKYRVELAEVDPPGLLQPALDDPPALHLRLDRRKVRCRCTSVPQVFWLRSAPPEDHLRLQFRQQDGNARSVAAVTRHALPIGGVFRDVGACWVPLHVRPAARGVPALCRVRVVWEVVPEGSSAFFHVPHDHLVSALDEIPDEEEAEFCSSASSHDGELAHSSNATAAYAAEEEEAKEIPSETREEVVAVLRRLLYLSDSTTSATLSEVFPDSTTDEQRYSNLYTTPCPENDPLVEHNDAVRLPSSALEYYRLAASRADAAQKKSPVDIPMRKSAAYLALKESILARSRE